MIRSQLKIGEDYAVRKARNALSKGCFKARLVKIDSPDTTSSMVTMTDDRSGQRFRSSTSHIQSLWSVWEDQLAAQSEAEALIELGRQALKMKQQQLEALTRNAGLNLTEHVRFLPGSTRVSVSFQTWEEILRWREREVSSE